MAVTKDFGGKLLISVTDGRNLGEIKGLMLDQSASRGVALFLGKSGIIKRKANLIDLKHVQLVGVDVWLTRNSDCVVSEEDYSDFEKLILAEDLFGREIVTEGGHKIGTIGDIVLDEKFNVLGFSFDKLQIEGPLAKAGAIIRVAVKSLGDSKTPAVASLDQAEKLTIAV